jgi:hypothetical protein
MVAMATKQTNWATRIRAAWQKSVAAIFEVGDLLIAAKKKMPHGQFERMVQNALPFGERTAQALMKIARDKRLREAHRGALLPPSWRTLDELTRLTDEQFSAALSNGVIRPDMERHDVPPRPRHAPEVYRAATYIDFSELSATEPQTINVAIQRTTRELSVPYVVGETRPLLEPSDFSAHMDRDAARRLIDAFRGVTPAICRAAAGLLAGERKADLPVVRRTIAELKDLLDSQ